MSNLILPEDKKTLRDDYRRRRLALLFGLDALGIIVSLVLLASIGIIVIAKERIYSQAAISAKAGATSQDYDRYEKEIKETNQAVRLFTADAWPLPRDLFAEVRAAKPAAVTLNSLAYSWTKERGLTITVGGIASSRKVLLGFVDELRKIPSFARVESPLSNLIKDTNADFKLEIAVKEKKK